MQSATSPGWILTPWGSRIVVVALTVLAYLPALGGDFLRGDDHRLIVDNEPVRELSAGHAVKYFTTPGTVAAQDAAGVYRPLRTLDFAIDWALSGGKPFLFHLKSLLYHVLASLLALALFLRLAGEGENRKAALLGALLFSLHPVQVESVAWISSRGDVLLLVLFLFALLLHLEGKYWAASLMLLAALMAKESAVVFPAVALALDYFRRARIRWGAFACYAGIAFVHYVAWRLMQPQAGLLDAWWGGSWPATARMMLRGAVFYARAVLVPVRFVYDYHVPAAPALDVGTLLGIAILAGSVIAFRRGGPRVRIAIAWFALAILPVSNLLFTVGIPTAERFVYLPMVGLAFAAGHLLARWRWAYSLPVLLCLGALTFFRCFEWRSDESLFRSAVAGEATPRGYRYLASRSLARAESAKKAREAGNVDRALAAESRRGAAATVRIVDDALRLLEDQVRTPGVGAVGTLLWQKASALLILGRVGEAYETAKAGAFGAAGGVMAFYHAGVAAHRLAVEEAKTARPGADVAGEIRVRLDAADLFEEAGELLSSAYIMGFEESDLLPRIAANYRQAADTYLYILDRETNPELMGEYHEKAALNFFKAANIHIELYMTRKDVDLLSAAIELHKAAGDNFERSAKRLEDLSPGERLAGLQKMAGDSYHQVGKVQEALGGVRKAILSYLHAGESYELAIRDISGSGVEVPAELLVAAAGTLFDAARLMEKRGEWKEAERFYLRSRVLAPNPRTQEALLRVRRAAR